LDDYKQSDLFKFGVVARVVHVRPDRNGHCIVLLEGVVRIEVTNIKNNIATYNVHKEVGIDCIDLKESTQRIWS
jgi:Lon protease-like protein